MTATDAQTDVDAHVDENTPVEEIAAPGRVNRYVVLEPKILEIGVGADVYSCPPGTVVYEPWVNDGLGVHRLVTLKQIAQAGTVDEGEIPHAPHGASKVLSRRDGIVDHDTPVDLGDAAPNLDALEGQDPAMTALLARVAEMEATISAQADQIAELQSDQAQMKAETPPGAGDGTGGADAAGAHDQAGTAPPAAPSPGA